MPKLVILSESLISVPEILMGGMQKSSQMHSKEYGFWIVRIETETIDTLLLNSGVPKNFQPFQDFTYQVLNVPAKFQLYTLKAAYA